MGLDEARERQCNWWCAACGGQYNSKWPIGALFIQEMLDAREAKMFQAHAQPQGECENLVCALKLSAIQQTDGDSLVETLFEGLQESKLINMDELRFIKVGDEAVKIGDLENNSEIKVVWRTFSTHFSRGAGPGVDELTLRRGEEGTLRFINTAKVEASRGPPVDEDWHAFCQLVYKGVAGAAWENLFCKFVEM